MERKAVAGGLLVAIEGIDGAGKTTLAIRLAEQLRAEGFEVVASKEPTSGPHGQALRATAAAGRLDPHSELQLLLADRADHVRALITPALARGAVVLLDRYYFSNAAYQGAAGLDVEHVLAVNEAFAPRPDLLLLLDLPVAEGLARIAGRGDRANAFEQAETLQRVREVFLDLIVRHGRLIDAGQAADAVFDEAREALMLVLAAKSDAAASSWG
jgi:dTMP kinase